MLTRSRARGLIVAVLAVAGITVGTVLAVRGYVDDRPNPTVTTTATPPSASPSAPQSSGRPTTHASPSVPFRPRSAPPVASTPAVTEPAPSTRPPQDTVTRTVVVPAPSSPSVRRPPATSTRPPHSSAPSSSEPPDLCDELNLPPLPLLCQP